MSLPSQSARSMTGSRASVSRKRSRPRIIGGVLVVAAVIVLATIWYTMSGSDADKAVSLTDGQNEQANTTTKAGLTALDQEPGTLMAEPLNDGGTGGDQRDGFGGEGTFNPDGSREVSSSDLPEVEPADAMDPLGKAIDDAVQGEGGGRDMSEPLVVEPDGVPASSEMDFPAEGRSGEKDAGGRGLTGSMALATADEAMKAGDLVMARKVLSRVVLDGRASAAERAVARERAAQINQELVFSSKVDKQDPLSEIYTIQSGDSLQRIVARSGLAVDWRLIQRVNGIANPNLIKVGQKLKLIHGPFHVIVNKGAYRLDLFSGSPGEPESWIYIRSYTVGLGKGDSTPSGSYVVKQDSKLTNPYWVNPRTGERFQADDPMNPIGERWVGIKGVGESAGNVGYGLHGTIDPSSIGNQESMGCVRLLPDDIEQVYEFLVEQVSIVQIVE